MRSLRRALLALGIVGFVAGALPLGLALATEDGHQRELIAIFGPLTGWAFIGSGLVVWLRRPHSSFAALMIAVGFTACLGALRVATEPWIFTVGLLFIPLPYAVLFHMLLAYPTGALRSGLDRLLVALTYVSAAVIHPVQMLFVDTAARGLPANEVLITASSAAASTLNDVRFWAGVTLISALGAVLVRRWRLAGGAERRDLAPVLLSGGLVMALYGVWFATGLAGSGAGLRETLEEARVVVLALVPFAFGAGLLSSRMADATALSELVASLGEGDPRSRIRETLAEALGDPSLDLAYCLSEDRYVDASGRRVELPGPGSGRSVTTIESGGEPCACVIHDISLSGKEQLVRAAGAAASLALENERLDAELRATIEELRASRSRIVASEDAARRRLERDLHDGAQQRLVALALNLRMLGNRLAGDPDGARELEAARRELEVALEELRELARGIHPAVLSDRGLAPALEGLAHRAPIPVELLETPAERLPDKVEATAYFVVGEALTNVVRHANATHAAVRVGRANGGLSVAISDDGIGGADPSGSGLGGLADRVSSLGGRLEVETAPGEGTTIKATIPCA